MEINITTYEGCERQLELTVTDAELVPHYEKAYAEAQPHIDLKGFRKGKVPIKLIKQYFGKKIEADALESISGQFLLEAVQKENIKIVGEPTLKDIKKTPEGMTFVIIFDVYPEFELADYRSLQIDEPVHPVGEEEIDEQIERILTIRGSTVETEEIADINHYVSLLLHKVDDETHTIILGEPPEETQLVLTDRSIIPQLREQLIGRRRGDSFIFAPNQFDPNAADVTYSISISKVHRIIPAEFSNQFVEEFTEGKFLTTEDFRQEIGFNLQEQWNEKSRNAMEDQIIEQVVDSNDFPVPESAVWTFLEYIAEDFRHKYKDVPDSSRIDAAAIADSMRPVAERSVKWELIRNKIIETEKLEVEDHDIDDYIESKAAKTGADPEVVRREAQKEQNLKIKLIQKKIIDLIMDFAITNEVTFEEYEHKHHDHDHDHDHEHHHEHDHEHDHEHHHGEDEEEHHGNIILP